MSRNLTTIFIIFAVSLSLAILGGLVWANVLYVRAHPGEKDFFVPWLAARTFIQYGDNPYSEAAAQRAQIIYYGRLAAEGESSLYLWLPFPVELFYIPFALIPDYAVARAVWMAFLEIALVALALLSIQVTGWKVGRLLLSFILIFSVLWVYGFFSLAECSAAVFAALALAGALLAMRSERDELAGALLGLLLWTPRLAGFLLLFLGWWIIFHRRWRFLWGCLMLQIFLFLFAFFFLPGWVIPYLHGAVAHNAYGLGLSSIGVLNSWYPGIGTNLGWLISAGLLFLLFFEWSLSIRKDSRRFLWTISLTLACTPLLGIPLAPKELVILFFPLIFFGSILAERWPRFLGMGAAAFTLLVTFAGLWLLASGLRPASLAQTEMLTFVLPILLIIGLYWMRWWIARPAPESFA